MSETVFANVPEVEDIDFFFQAEDGIRDVAVTGVQTCALPILAEAGFLHRSGGNWHWVQEAYPADTVSLRSVTSDNFVIIDTSGEEDGSPEVIGEVDFSSALTTVHPKAIYIHQGQQYQVERLDFDARKAYVKPVNVDYYTDAIRYTQVRVLEIADEQSIPGPAVR